MSNRGPQTTILLGLLTLALGACTDDTKPPPASPLDAQADVSGAGGSRGTGGNRGTGGARAGTGGSTGTPDAGGVSDTGGAPDTAQPDTGAPVDTAAPIDTATPQPDVPAPQPDVPAPQPDLPVQTGNSISGTVDGLAFGSIASALWIGKPDAAGSTIVFLFSSPITCSAISAKGWDSNIGNAQTLELRFEGTTAKSYTVAAVAQTGQAEAVHTDPDGVLSQGQSGSLTIATITASQNVTGTFNATFATGSLSGSFDATYCANGVEPDL